MAKSDMCKADVTIVGEVSDDPVLHNSDGKKALLNLSVKTAVRFGDKEETHFHSVTVWGDDAARLEKKIDKGDLVRVVGRLGPDKRESETKGTYWDQRVNVDDDTGSVKLADKGDGHQNSVELLGTFNSFTVVRGKNGSRILKLTVKTEVPAGQNTSTGYHDVVLFDKIAAASTDLLVGKNPDSLRLTGRVRRQANGKKDTDGKDIYEPAVIIDDFSGELEAAA